MAMDKSKTVHLRASSPAESLKLLGKSLGAARIMPTQTWADPRKGYLNSSLNPAESRLHVSGSILLYIALQMHRMPYLF